MGLQWKMSFNPDPQKQAQEVVFSRKSKQSHPSLIFNNNDVTQATAQKHLDIILDTRLSFEKHLETLLCKTNKSIRLILKLQNLLPRSALITLYKVSARPNLDYCDSSQSIVSSEIRVLQYNACLAITGAIRGSLREKLNQDLGFESL